MVALYFTVWALACTVQLPIIKKVLRNIR